MVADSRMLASQREIFCLSTSVFLNKELTKSEHRLLKISHPELLDHASMGRDTKNQRCGTQTFWKCNWKHRFPAPALSGSGSKGFLSGSQATTLNEAFSE